MKTLQELLQEKEGYFKKSLEIEKAINEFKKPLCLNLKQYKEYHNLKKIDRQKAEEYYKPFKTVFDANKQKKEGLEKKSEIYKLASQLIDANIIIAFSNLYKEKIITILNKYIKKRIGEKTLSKIKNEIKALDENIKTVIINFNQYCYNNNIIIILNNGLEIEFTKTAIDGWLNGNGEPIVNLTNYIIDNYDYIDKNILELAKEKIEKKEQLKKEVEEQINKLEEKIDNFNNFYCKSEYFKLNKYRLFDI